MIPRYLMIQKEFQLEVWTLIIQKSTTIPPSSMVLFLGPYGHFREKSYNLLSLHISSINETNIDPQNKKGLVVTNTYCT